MGNREHESALNEKTNARAVTVKVPPQLALVKGGLSEGLFRILRGTYPRTTRTSPRKDLKTIRVYLDGQGDEWLSALVEEGYSERGAIIEALSWVFEHRHFITQVPGHKIEPDMEELWQKAEDDQAAAREAAEADNEADESADTDPVSHGKVDAETEAESEPESSEWEAGDERE